VIRDMLAVAGGRYLPRTVTLRVQTAVVTVLPELKRRLRI